MLRTLHNVTPEVTERERLVGSRSSCVRACVRVSEDYIKPHINLLTDQFTSSDRAAWEDYAMWRVLVSALWGLWSNCGHQSCGGCQRESEADLGCDRANGISGELTAETRGDCCL